MCAPYDVGTQPVLIRTVNTSRNIHVSEILIGHGTVRGWYQTARRKFRRGGGLLESSSENVEAAKRGAHTSYVEYLSVSFTGVPLTSAYILQINRMYWVSSDYMLRDQKECERRGDNKTSCEDRARARVSLFFVKFIGRLRESTLRDETPERRR